ncbi:MAG: hypothetical protein WDN75_19600 [Bacteroidota bacterium]
MRSTLTHLRFVTCRFFSCAQGQVHQLELRAGCTGYLMEFKPDFYYPYDKISGELLQKVSSKNVCRIAGNRFQKLMSLLAGIFDEFTQKEERYLAGHTKQSISLLYRTYQAAAKRRHSFRQGY